MYTLLLINYHVFAERLVKNLNKSQILSKEVKRSRQFAAIIQVAGVWTYLYTWCRDNRSFIRVITPLQKSISKRASSAVKAADRFRFLNFSARFCSQVYEIAAHARGGDEPIGAREDEPAGKLKRRAVAATTQTRPLGTRTWAFVGVGCVFFRARSRSQEGRRSARGDSL